MKRHNAFLLLIVVAILLVAFGSLWMDHLRLSALLFDGKPFDVEKVRNLIEKGQLSSKESKWFRIPSEEDNYVEDR